VAGNKVEENIFSKAPHSEENYIFLGKLHPWGFSSVTISQRTASSLCLLHLSSWLLLYAVSSIFRNTVWVPKTLSSCKRVKCLHVSEEILLQLPLTRKQPCLSS